MRTAALVAIALGACKGDDAAKPPPPPAVAHVADAAPAPDKPVPPPPQPMPFTDPRIGKAVAARTLPLYTPPAQTQEPAGRCAVKIHARSDADGAAIFAELQKRNPKLGKLQLSGGEPMEVPVNLPFSQFIDGVVYTPSDRPPKGTTIATDRAEQIAIDFVANDYDLLGLEPDDLASATVKSRPDDVLDEVEFDGARPTPGYETLADVTRTWRVMIEVRNDGQVVGVHNQTQELYPPFQICTDAKLSPDDAKKTIKEPVDDIALTIHAVGADDGKSVTLHLAYKVDTQGKMYTSWIDADTGEELMRVPNFSD